MSVKLRTPPVPHVDTRAGTPITRREALRYACAALAFPIVTGGVMTLPANSHAAQGNTPHGTPRPDQPETGQSRALIVYYSRTGNTRTVAEYIHAQLGGMPADVLEIETVAPYPGDYRATTTQAKKELAEGYRPPLRTKVADMAPYSLVFVGSPNWWSTIAPPVMTFLSEYDFSGKRIAPFMTHGGGGLGTTVADIRTLCPAATVLEALSVPGRSAATAQKDVAAWLRRLGLHA